MDWTSCDVVEHVPGKIGGRPVVKGASIEPEVILIDEEYGRTAKQTPWFRFRLLADGSSNPVSKKSRMRLLAQKPGSFTRVDVGK
jgi:hypothetical protein